MYDVVLFSPINTQLGLFKRFVPRSIPIGLGIIAGFLEENGISVKFVDQDLIKLDLSKIREIMEKCNRPRIAGISVMTANIANGAKIAEMIKLVDRKSTVILGGIHTTVMPDEVLEDKNVDFIIKGEGEYPMLELVKQIKSGKVNPAVLENVGYREDGKNVYTKSASKMVDINKIPMFPYHMFDPSDYNLGFILTSRGCPFDCIFCSQRAITQRMYRYVESERVIEELDFLVNKMKQPNVTFFDDYFTGHKKRVFELCEMIKKRGLHKKASFGAQTRGDSIDKELLETMLSANFNGLMFGVETASERLMKLINKNETVQENIDAIRLAKQLGFGVEATFIFGFPTETFQDRLDAFMIAVETGLDKARFNNVTPYPGTQLYEMVLSEIKKAPMWANFSAANAVTAGIIKDFHLPYTPENTTEAELEGTILLANLLFYFNLKKLKNLFNPGQKGSGKWFELPAKELLSPKTLFALFVLGSTIFIRGVKFLLLSRNCRRFFFKAFRA